MWQRGASRVSQTQRPYRVMGNRGNPSGSTTATDQGNRTSIVMIVNVFNLFFKVF